MAALEPIEDTSGGYSLIGHEGDPLRYCNNAAHAACNWLTSASGGDGFCRVTLRGSIRQDQVLLVRGTAGGATSDALPRLRIGPPSSINAVAAGSDYPGETTMREFARRNCTDGFEAYVGRPYETSELEVGYYLPSSSEWESGARRIGCYLYDVGGDKLVGSVQGSGR